MADDAGEVLRKRAITFETPAEPLKGTYEQQQRWSVSKEPTKVAKESTFESSTSGVFRLNRTGTPNSTQTHRAYISFVPILRRNSVCCVLHSHN